MANDNGGITSPEGVLMLFIAVGFDLLSFIITVIGIWFVFPLIIDLILDFLPIFIIGGWALIRGLWSGDKGTGEVKEYAQETTSKIKSKILESQKSNATKSAEKIANKGLGRKLLTRLGLTSLVEIAPVIGALVPAWTIFVYKEMGGMNVPQNNSENSDNENGNKNEGETSLLDGQNEITSTPVAPNAKIQSQPANPKTNTKK